MEEENERNCRRFADVEAIITRNLFASVSVGLLSCNRKTILQGLDMTISKGTIYGLLGPSGCGKTTLLNCIVGQTKADSGSVTVFGFRAGTKGSGIPGSRVGYMPQDVALSQDLKVGETLNFYGVLLGMTATKIKTKSKFLAQLLELPPNERFIDTLSGGQQRRVSLAVALINDPELIILDEPTVGVDPLLRKSIWNHLFELASNNKQTILITTHYIEEARMAHTVGMMSDGVIICDGSPDNIMQEHGCSSLESVFLKLCIDRENIRSTEKADPNDNETEQQKHILSTSESPSEAISFSTLNKTNSDVRRRIRSDSIPTVKRESLLDKLKTTFELPNMNRIRAVTECNMRKSYRHIGHVLVHVFVPFLLMIVFNLTINGLPKNIPVGVFNQDVEDFGVVYLSYVDSDAVELKTYSSYEEGYQAVKNGDTRGLIHLHSNFSTLLINRFLHGHEMGHDVPFQGAISIAMDVTCHPVSLVVNDALIDAFIKFGQKLITNAGLQPELISPPFEITYDIYGRDENGLMGFAVSGIILCGIYFLSVANCLLSLFRDKASGQLTRNIVCGITFLELLLANVATFSVAVLIQTASYLVFTFGILGYTCQGPIYAVGVLILLHGICGVTYGLFISTLCSSEFTAVMLAFGTFLPSICLSGTIWPIESIPPIFRDACWLFPQSYVVEALRSLMTRSWDLAYVATVYGLVTNIFWIVLFLTLSTTLLWLRQNVFGLHCGCVVKQRSRKGKIQKDIHTSSYQLSKEFSTVVNSMENGTEQHHCAPVVSSLVRSTYPIVVRNAYKSYWQRKSETRVLADLNLSIPQGTIYGLLGPSGCGKTTLLRCIVGRLHLDKGLILTLGQTPGTPQSGIPGPRIGFMPQEEALDGILTIKELFHYFGCIMGVHKKEMKKKAKFLCDFLKLPSKNSLFSTLSGGQKRRVSFAVTLIHDAELYILDEPTVGVDPILKQSIWNYLFQLVEGGKKTVIITTHYIEEARGANFVGMMFDGRLLAEGPPERLIELYNKSTLEDVFLDICQMQKNNNSERVRRENVEDFNNTIPLLVNGDALNDRDTSTVDEAELCEVKSIRKDSVHLQNPSGVFKFCPDIQWMKLNAIIQRNFIQLFRYPGLFLLIMVLPSIQVAMCNFAIGRFILSINLGVVNHDNGHLAQGFLSRLDNRIIEQINFSDFDVARSAAKNGQTRGVLSFDQDFSYSIVERFNKTPFVSQEVLRKSTINLSLDGTSFIFAETVRVVLLTTYEKFLSDILVVNNMDPNMGILPIIYDKPIYGKNEDEYISFIMPGFIAAAAFFSQLGLSVIALFLDRDGGKLERIYTAGVTSFEMIFGFLVLQVVVVMAQTTLMLVLTFVVLEYDNDGSIFMIIAMTISQGICGITLGLLVASITDTFMSAAAVSVTILITSAALGGFFWPIEAMPSFIKAICSWLPFAPAANSFRHMMYRGWSLFHGDIMTAFGVTYGWTLILLLSAIVIVRLRKGT